MITTNNRLFDLARSLDNGQPKDGDNEVDIPSTLVPSITLMAPLDAVNVLPATRVDGSSSAGTAISVVAGVGSGTTQIMTLAKGLWRLHPQMSLATNYVSFGANANIVMINPNTGQSIVLLGMTVGGAAAAPVVQYASRELDLLIPFDNANISVVTSNNAAGQSMTGYAQIIAVKLL